MTIELERSAVKPTLETLSVDVLAPHPDNPRLMLREDVVEQLAAEMSRSGFGAQHAITARPLNGGFQIIAGHHRVEAARRVGVDVPTWITEMDDDEAFMQLVLSNSQGELTPLEIGMHALKAVPKSKGGRGHVGGLSEYADRLGRSKQYLSELHKAADVLQTVRSSGQFTGDLTERAKHLYEISKAPKLVQHLLAATLVKSEWTVAQTSAAVSRVNEFVSKLPDGTGDWLPLKDVVARHLAAPERFTPTTIGRLLNAAQQVDEWIEANGGDQSAFDHWLIENRGADSWDYRQLIAYRARLAAAAAAEAAARAEEEAMAAKLEVPDWRLGSWEDHIDTLADGSVSFSAPPCDERELESPSLDVTVAYEGPDGQRRHTAIFDSPSAIKSSSRRRSLTTGGRAPCGVVLAASGGSWASWWTNSGSPTASGSADIGRGPDDRLDLGRPRRRGMFLGPGKAGLVGRPVTDHGFGPHAEMALYDEHRNRVTPWFPVGEVWPGRRSDFGITVRWVGVRDWDEFEWFTANLTLTGGTCTIELPDWRQQPTPLWGSHA